MRWSIHGSLGFEVVPTIVWCIFRICRLWSSCQSKEWIPSLVQDGTSCKWGDITLSRSAHRHESLRIYLTSIRVTCCKLKLSVCRRVRKVFGLTLAVIGTLQESGEPRIQITTWKASWDELFTKTKALESQEQKLWDENRRDEHQRVDIKVEKRFHAPPDMKCKKEITYAKVEFVNAKEALPVLERWTSADRSAMHTTI